MYVAGQANIMFAVGSHTFCTSKTIRTLSLTQGAPVGLHVLEVRDTSVVVLWEPPAFEGRTPVNGYYLDLKEASAGDEGWKAVHEKANKNKYIKVRGDSYLLYLVVAFFLCE